MNDTFERLSALLVKDFRLPPERLTLEAPLESLGIDSLGMLEMLWNLEDAFRIKLPPESVDLRTLGDVVRYIDPLVAAQAGLVAPALRRA